MYQSMWVCLHDLQLIETLINDYIRDKSETKNDNNKYIKQIQNEPKIYFEIKKKNDLNF